MKCSSWSGHTQDPPPQTSGHRLTLSILNSYDTILARGHVVDPEFYRSWRDDTLVLVRPSKISFQVLCSGTASSYTCDYDGIRFLGGAVGDNDHPFVGLRFDHCVLVTGDTIIIGDMIVTLNGHLCMVDLLAPSILNP